MLNVSDSDIIENVNFIANFIVFEFVFIFELIIGELELILILEFYLEFEI